MPSNKALPSEELQVESFAAWMLAAQIGVAAGQAASPAAAPQPVAAAQQVENKTLTAIMKYVTATAKVTVPSDVKIVVAETRPTRGGYVAPNAEGWVYTGDKTVFVSGWTDTYKKAVSGDRNAQIKLASVIVHELEHTKGLGEKEAYTAQLKALRNMGAPKNIIAGVEMAGKLIVGGHGNPGISR